MKKLITLLLVLLGGITQVSATDWYLRGTFNSWSENNPFTNGQVTISLGKDQEYEFKITGDGWYGNSGTMYWYECNNWEFKTNEGTNCTIRTADAGNYTFTFDEDTKKLSVTYPTTQRTIYFYNNLSGWSTPYAYILGGAYWDDNLGSGSKGRPVGIQMTQIDDTNIWKADFQCPSSVSTCSIAFLKNQQDNYGNFYDTEAVYRSDFRSNAPLFVSNGTQSDNLNSTKYMSNGSWYEYPTSNYERNITSGKFGTLCLPFSATVTGATVFEITSKVISGETLTGINLTSTVDNKIEAGKAYIFKATSSKLTATPSDSYSAEAIEANGMIGNLSSTAITLTGSTTAYVIGSDNKIHKVIGGGSGVTVGQYKGYITLTDVNAATSRELNYISFEDDDVVTSIDALNLNEKADKDFVNLAGQRVAQPTKGLYIVNGKKVVIK